MIFWSVLYLIIGTTIYLLIFKREFMVVSNRRAPKFFLAAVCLFSVFFLALTQGHLDWMIYA